MRTLEEVRGNCRIDEEGHWIWAGALWKGKPRIYAPDHTRGGAMQVQSGARAVWHLMNKKPLPNGYWAFNTCSRPACVAPKCVDAGTTEDHGQNITAKGHLKGKINRTLANRRNAAKRSKVTPEMEAEILRRAESETYGAIAADLGLCPETVGLVNRGQKPLLRPLGGLLSGLIAANGAARMRA